VDNILTTSYESFLDVIFYEKTILMISTTFNVHMYLIIVKMLWF